MTIGLVTGSVLRTSLRSLLRTPIFAFTAIAALALGIGVNTAIFSAINALMLRPAFIDDPDKIAVIGPDYVRRNVVAAPASIGDVIDAKAARHLFSHVAVMAWTNMSYTPPGGLPERIVGGSVSPGWFETFGARPLLGRTFRPDEELPGNHRVVVLSHGLWQRLFGGERDAIGRRMQFSGEEYEIVGVMPPEFRWPVTAELWHPMTMRPGFLASQPRLAGGYPMYARLRPGVTRERAQTELQSMADRAYPPREAELIREMGRRLRVRSFLEFQTTRTAAQPAPVIGAVFFVLLIACANVAGMLLARGAGRAREMAVRSALGAGRWQLMQPVLMESAMIAGAGIAAGLGVAWGLLRVLIVFAPPGEFSERFLHFDGAVLAFTIAAGAGAGLLFGVLPSWQVTSLGGSRSAAPRQRMRSALVVSEIALALVLLVGAGLFLRSVRNLQLVSPGFDTHGLMTAELQFPPGSGTAEQHAQFFRTVVDRLKATPGVTDAAISSAVPLLGNESRYNFTIPGRDLSGDPFLDVDRIAGMARRVTPDYFSTLGVRITSGRGFTDGDVKGSEPVLIADEALAARYFPRHDAVGQHLQLGRRPHRIIGVAASIRQLEPGITLERPLFYLPMYADPNAYAAFLLRGTGNLSQILRETVQAVNPGLAVFNAQPLEERVYTLLAPRRITAWVLTFFAGSALFLAALGLYGVISYSVSQRVHEIGIRMALGARAEQVTRLVLGQGLRLALLGAALGLLGAIAVSRAVARQLFQVGVLDPSGFRWDGVAAHRGRRGCQLAARPASRYRGSAYCSAPRVTPVAVRYSPMIRRINWGRLETSSLAYNRCRYVLTVCGEMPSRCAMPSSF